MSEIDLSHLDLNLLVVFDVLMREGSVDAFQKVTAGLIDLVEIAGSFEATEGVETLQGRPFTWTTFAREDHPAIDCWGVDAWERWPHVKLKIGTAGTSPVEEVARGGGPRRTAPEPGWPAG